MWQVLVQSAWKSLHVKSSLLLKSHSSCDSTVNDALELPKLSVVAVDSNPCEETEETREDREDGDDVFSSVICSVSELAAHPVVDRKGLL